MDKNTGVGSLFLLQGIFPTKGSNTGLLYCRQILSHQENTCESDQTFSKKGYYGLCSRIFQIIRENSKPVRCTHGKQVMPARVNQ